MGLEGDEVSIIFYIIVFFFVVLPMFIFIIYIFNDDDTEGTLGAPLMILFQIFGFLVPNYYILFGDINCSLSENRDTTILRIAYKDTINDIIYFNSKNKEARGKDYMKNICKEYNYIQKEVEEKSKIDYEDNVVNSLIFDASYNINYYKIKDMGEKEFMRKQREISNKIELQIKP